MSTSTDRPRGWVLLSNRLPREPSTPRITVWRKLKRPAHNGTVDRAAP